MQYSIWLDGNKFTYSLLNIRPAKVWADLISQTRVDSLRGSLDPWHGVTKGLYEKISRFNYIIDRLNTWMPVPIPGYFNETNPTESLNRLHIHFPEHEQNETDVTRLQELYEYNDLIHQIDLGLRSNNSKLFVLVCPHIDSYVKLELNDYQYFTSDFSVGDLLIHYAHIGRHPMEIFGARDINCPSDQIICQSRISPSHSLRFYNSSVNKENFSKFYYGSRLQWPYQLKDPRLAFGYIKIGNLVSINDSTNVENSIDIVKQCSKITNWAIDKS